MNSIKTINLLPNNNHKSLSISLEIQKKFESKGYKISYDFDEDAELNICIGGDGAFLRAVHKSKFSSIPFVGINTGHLGFYQEILEPNINKFIDDYINKNYEIESLDLLEAKVTRKNKKEVLEYFSLNEFVVRSTDLSLIHLDVYIDNYHLESFAGDALLVSTPSGSTAYNFSSGGAILYRSLKGYQLTPLAPINSKAYRSLLNSVVIPSDSVLKIRTRSEDINDNSLIINDGMNLDFKDLDFVEFKIAERQIKKLSFYKDWYWLNIKDKFL